MSNYSPTSPLFFVLIMVGCSAVPTDEKSSLVNTDYRQQTEILEEQHSRSKNLDSDERKIEAAILASAKKDFKTVKRLLLSIKDPEKNNIFTGEFWTGKASLKLGLIDGIGNADQVLKDKFGDKVIIKTFEKPKGFIARKLSSSFQDPVEKLANMIEEKSMWQRFGL